MMNDPWKVAAVAVEPTPSQEPAPQGLDLLDRQLAYTLFRLTLGVSLLLHGATRLLAGSAGAFPLFRLEDPVLPAALAPLFPGAVALAATVLGLLLTLGLWTRGALLAGGVLVTVLAAGAACRTDVQTLTVQTGYLAMFYLLPAAIRYNTFAVDTLLRASSAAAGQDQYRSGL
jgi:thiosulfate dehydrogenase [quinone] large subunit